MKAIGCWQKGEKQKNAHVGDVFSWRAVSEKASLGCFALGRGSMALQDDGRAKRRSLLTCPGERRGEGASRHWCGIMHTPSMVRLFKGGADIWGSSECLKSFKVQTVENGVDWGSLSLGSCPGW